MEETSVLHRTTNCFAKTKTTMAPREPLQIWPDASLSGGAKKTMEAANDVWVDCSLLASKKGQKKEEGAKDKGGMGANLEGYINNGRERGIPGEGEMGSVEIPAPVNAISGVYDKEVAGKGGEEEGVEEGLKTRRNAVIGKSVSVLRPREEHSPSAAKVEITNGSGEEGTGEKSSVVISLYETDTGAKKKKTETNPTPTSNLIDRLTTTTTMTSELASASEPAPAHLEGKKESSQAENSTATTTATTTPANTKTTTAKRFPIPIPMRIPMQIPIKIPTKIPKRDNEKPHMQPETAEMTETNKTTKSETLDVPGLFNNAKNVKQILLLTLWFLLFCTVVVLLDGPAAHAKTTPGFVFRGMCWAAGGFLRALLHGAVSGIFPMVYSVTGEVVRRLVVGMLAAFRG